eukprot:3228069-Prymnesium_polylepis.1
MEGHCLDQDTASSWSRRDAAVGLAGCRARSSGQSAWHEYAASTIHRGLASSILSRQLCVSARSPTLVLAWRAGRKLHARPALQARTR